MLLLKTKLLPRDHFDMLGLIDRWNRRRQYQTVVSKGYNPFDYNNPPSPSIRDSAAEQLIDQIQEKRAEVHESIARGQLQEATRHYQLLQGLQAGQTLSRGAQLDIANQFYADQEYEQAASAYELFLKSYGTSEQAGHVELMLGLAYSRHLNQPEKAREHLVNATRLLQFSRELEIAQAELQRIQN